MAVLFIGVAASSSFEHASQLELSPGQSTRVGSYLIRYVHPTATITPKYDAAHTGSTLNLGALLDVSEHGRHVATLDPSEGYYASGEASLGSVGSLLGGQPVSHIAMDVGLTRNVWSAIEPDIKAPRLQRIVSDGNSTLPPEEAVVAIAYMAREYIKHPPPAQFNFLVSPLVMWIWFGGAIVLMGGLIALWPAPSVVRRRVAARSRARALRGLARA
jgi:cytochrome c-type biogenesis protein CcmF